MKKKNIIPPLLIFVPAIVIPYYCNFQPEPENKYCAYVRPYIESSDKENFVFPTQNTESINRIASSATLSGTVTGSAYPLYYPGTNSF